MLVMPAQIAASLRAEKLILMTDVPGIMRNKDDPSTKFPALSIRNCKELVDEGVIAGGMIPKVSTVQPRLVRFFIPRMNKR